MITELTQMEESVLSKRAKWHYRKFFKRGLSEEWFFNSGYLGISRYRKKAKYPSPAYLGLCLDSAIYQALNHEFQRKRQSGAAKVKTFSQNHNISSANTAEIDQSDPFESIPASESEPAQDSRAKELWDWVKTVLTPYEYECIQLWASGEKLQTCAEKLGRSTATISALRRTALEKLAKKERLLSQKNSNSAVIPEKVLSWSRW